MHITTPVNRRYGNAELYLALFMTGPLSVALSWRHESCCSALPWLTHCGTCTSELEGQVSDVYLLIKYICLKCPTLMHYDFFFHFVSLKSQVRRVARLKGIQRICTIKYLFFWNFRLASKKKEQINSLFYKISDNSCEILEVLFIEVITLFILNILK